MRWGEPVVHVQHAHLVVAAEQSAVVVTSLHVAKGPAPSVIVDEQRYGSLLLALGKVRANWNFVTIPRSHCEVADDDRAVAGDLPELWALRSQLLKCCPSLDDVVIT